jgi:hypothetical protein
MMQSGREEAMVDGFDQGSLELDAREIFAASATAEPGENPRSTTEAGLAELFRDYESGGSSAADEPQYGARFALGLAFRDVGLLDEAIAEFILAAADEIRRPECASMIGLCYMEKEMPLVATMWFDVSLASFTWRE